MKILYFTDDFSAENVAYAEQNRLTIRKASAYYEGDTLEVCDAVCGDVPGVYAEHYPHHEIDAPKQSNPDTVAEIKAALEALGVDIPAGAKKAELEQLLKNAQGDGGE